MSLLDKILFLADSIEPGRKFDGVELLRKTAYENLDRSCILAIEGTVKHALAQRQFLHPQTIHTYNHLLNPNGEE